MFRSFHKNKRTYRARLLCLWITCTLLKNDDISFITSRLLSYGVQTDPFTSLFAVSLTVVTNRPECFAVVSSARQTGKIRLFSAAASSHRHISGGSLLHCEWFHLFLSTGRHYLRVQFITVLKKNGYTAVTRQHATENDSNNWQAQDTTAFQPTAF